MRTDHDPDDVYLGTDIDTGEEVWLPYEDRVLGVTIIGKMGTGKSTILEKLILADLAHGTPGLIIDPHGQLAERVIRCARPEQADGIIVLEAIQTKPFGLNLLAVRDPVDENDDPVTWSADSVVATVKKLYGEDDEFLPRLERYLDLAVRTLIPSRLTLIQATRLFTDKSFRNQCLARVPDAKEREKLRNDWAGFDRLRPGEQITHTEALVNRLDRLFAPPLIQGIVGSKRTTVPFDQVLDGDRMMIVSLPSERLSRERCNFIGALILCGLADKIFARKVSSEIERLPRLHIYLDEYQRFATSTTAELLTEGRKYEAGMTLAHQAVYQITDRTIRDASRQSGTLIALALTRPDADELAGEFPVEPREEWIETIQEQTDFKQETIFSPTPSMDILTKSHRNQSVVEAAHLLVIPASWSDLLPPPAGIRNSSIEFMIRSHELDPLLYKAMSTGAPGPVELLSGLFEILFPDCLELPMNFEQGEYRNYFGDGCSHWAKLRESPSGRDEYYFPGSMDAYEVQKHLDPSIGTIYGSSEFWCHWTAYNNKQLLALKIRDFEELRTRLKEWLGVHSSHLASFLAGEDLPAFQQADTALVDYAIRHWWSAMGPQVKAPYDRSRTQFMWHGQDARYRSHIPDERPLSDIREQMSVVLRRLREHLAYVYRWSDILCQGLAAHPTVVATSTQVPRETTRHIVHPRQTEQDALNEMASRLAHPPERHVAYVRLPTSYHKVRLAPPLQPIASSSQVDEVRARSQDLYRADQLGDESEPPDKPGPAQQQPHEPPPRITRFPRQHPEPDTSEPEESPSTEEGERDERSN
jgi:hypothetical protein